MWWASKQAAGNAPTADSTLSAGAQAEQLAADYLQRQGLKVLARNVRCKGGELDVVAEHNGTIVFVEVRLRSDARFGGAQASIDTRKQRRVILAARHWLNDAGRKYANRRCRFDAILLQQLDKDAIEWLRDAFTAS